MTLPRELHQAVPARRCEWCGIALAPRGGPGRPRRYCRRSHRQRAYEARQAAQTRRLRPDEVVVAESTWEMLQVSLQRLQVAGTELVTRLDQQAGGDDSGAVEYAAAVGRLAAAISELTGTPRDAIARW